MASDDKIDDRLMEHKHASETLRMAQRNGDYIE